MREHPTDLEPLMKSEDVLMYQDFICRHLLQATTAAIVTTLALPNSATRTALRRIS